ncbi:MAG: esterase family protein [Planctomycetes bacterium]|nr:esterase family protein [Planctomycetota bacterium]
MRLHRVLVCVATLLSPACSMTSPPPPGDVYEVTLDPAARSEPASGRVLLFFIDADSGRRNGRQPAQGPFFEPPQPIASVPVSDFAPGETIRIDGTAVAFPESVDRFDGSMRVQAVLDADDTERGHLTGAGNVVSEPVKVQVRRDAADVVALTLSRRLDPPRPTKETPNLRWVNLRSDLLSRFYGRDVFHRAGIALPPGYADPEHVGRVWPTVYVIPGFGGRYWEGATYAHMLSRRGIEEIAPMAVHVVLDPESPLGHHGFVDSPNHGPRRTALVTELIPWLEREFRVARASAGRIVTGHSSGGWTALWLQLNEPEVFGACWANAPDPVDFSAFQMCDLYEDDNLYKDADGKDVPSYRRPMGPEGEMRVAMTVREEGLMERAIDPGGGSGQQWDAWEAMFSPATPDGQRGAGPFVGRPRPLFDAETGRIDRAVVEHWRRFDITRLVTGDWERFGPIVMGRVRLSVGGWDSFYLERAVIRFKEKVDRLAAEGGGWTGPGYINVVPEATHGTLGSKIFQRVNREMREHLREHGWPQH